MQKAGNEAGRLKEKKMHFLSEWNFLNFLIDFLPKKIRAILNAILVPMHPHSIQNRIFFSRMPRSVIFIIFLFVSKNHQNSTKKSRLI